MTAGGGALWHLSATELAELIRSREASSLQVVEAHLSRIEAVNPLVNAVTEVMAERAIDAAKAADRATSRAGGEAGLPPLHGVPFTVKANIDLAGSATTQGARALTHAYPERDAPCVERLKAAGAIPVGRTNLPSFAIRWHTDSELWGPTTNPWDRALTPGASSGGDAAALATGMSPLGLGSDMLGSLRWPAQCCGITALKPTLGRVPHASALAQPDLPIGTQLMMVVGPLARRVGDLQAALAVMAGPTWRDPWTVPAPLRGAEPGRPVRVAVVTDPGGHPSCAQVRDGVRKAAAALASAGYAVDEAEPPGIAAAARTALDMLGPDMRTSWRFLSPTWSPDTRQFMSSLLKVAGPPDRVTAMLSFMTRQSLLRAWGEFAERHRLIVAPVSTGIPFPAGQDLTVAEVAAIVADLAMTLAVSALGLPAVALPVGVADGLPQSVQIIGPRFREDLCLEAAAAVEAAVGILTPIDPRASATRR